ncbi:MAG: tetratricopeptide repeat protein [Tenuifilaceae bacterium]|nr:tetratricopeptide repeat protein [Tenuifilaceae bacterium]
MIRTVIVLSLTMLLFAPVGYAQSERKAVRKGNKEFKKGEYLDSEIFYRSALEHNPASFKGNFNLGGALYKQDKFEESANLYADMAKASSSANDNELASVYHNLGNSYFSQEMYEESVEAFKNSLRQNPHDMETKYNLAQAQRMLQLQQQEQDQDQNQDENSDDDQQQDQNQDDQQQDQNQDQQDQNQQEREQQISPEDARRMLEAIQNNEQQVQERVQEEKAKKAKVQVEKNW